MSEERKNFLIMNGIDMENALNYVGDYETYDEIMSDFYDGVDEQLGGIQATMNDMPNYAILIHALKSNFRCLGMKDFAEVCYQHEMQSKANNQEYVTTHFNEVIDQVNKFKALVQKYKEIQ